MRPVFVRDPKNSLPQKIPALLTRISTLALRRDQRIAAGGGRNVGDTPCTLLPDTPASELADGRIDPAWLRPLITTSAPAAARPLAIAKPMPAVEPVTSAVFPERSIFMRASPLYRRWRCGAHRRASNRRAQSTIKKRRRGAALKPNREALTPLPPRSPATGPESWPLASTSRSTNSITAIAALSP